ncbi:uncharacterized protein HaLaN_20471 [Haematococcus lacustris]|uniref:WD_REPEATS_REGION domain-containing protein n=1 Tax=Haematococcus lacustris TaxID=44745 RepID=A0A699ZJX0_HAELA|nr:uncharacterized protein HaLaN_20471 [Haematococcus lacustris]
MVLVLGTSSGSVHSVDLSLGRAVASTSTSDHMDSVTGLAASHYLQHFVTCSKDSSVKTSFSYDLTSGATSQQLLLFPGPDDGRQQAT